MANMVTINGKEYDRDALSDEAKQQLTNVQAVDQEIARLNMQLAIAQTARVAYGKALKDALPKEKATKSKK